MDCQKQVGGTKNGNEESCQRVVYPSPQGRSVLHLSFPRFAVFNGISTLHFFKSMYLTLIDSALFKTMKGTLINILSASGCDSENTGKIPSEKKTYEASRLLNSMKPCGAPVHKYTHTTNTMFSSFFFSYLYTYKCISLIYFGVMFFFI